MIEYVYVRSLQHIGQLDQLLKLSLQYMPVEQQLPIPVDKNQKLIGNRTVYRNALPTRCRSLGQFFSNSTIHGLAISHVQSQFVNKTKKRLVHLEPHVANILSSM
jgi:hypothetical protein